MGITWAIIQLLGIMSIRPKPTHSLPVVCDSTEVSDHVSRLFELQSAEITV